MASRVGFRLSAQTPRTRKKFERITPPLGHNVSDFVGGSGSPSPCHAASPTQTEVVNSHGELGVVDDAGSKVA